MTYTKLNDETLVEIYRKENDKRAFEELFSRYAAFFREKYWYTVKTTKVDPHIVQSKLTDLFCDAVKRYDHTKGASFYTFMRKRFKTATYDVLRAAKYGKKLDEDGDQEVLNQAPDNSDLEGDLIVQDIFNYLHSKNRLYPTFLKLLLDGYTYEEIGAQLCRHGSPAAIRNWGKRVKAKIAQYVLEYYGEDAPIKQRQFPSADGSVKRLSARLAKHSNDDDDLV